MTLIIFPSRIRCRKPARSKASIFKREPNSNSQLPLAPFELRPRPPPSPFKRTKEFLLLQPYLFGILTSRLPTKRLRFHSPSNYRLRQKRGGLKPRASVSAQLAAAETATGSPEPAARVSRRPAGLRSRSPSRNRPARVTHRRRCRQRASLPPAEADGPAGRRPRAPRGGCGAPPAASPHAPAGRGAARPSPPRPGPARRRYLLLRTLLRTHSTSSR